MLPPSCPKLRMYETGTFVFSFITFPLEHFLCLIYRNFAPNYNYNLFLQHCMIIITGDLFGGHLLLSPIERKDKPYLSEFHSIIFWLQDFVALMMYILHLRNNIGTYSTIQIVSNYFKICKSILTTFWKLYLLLQYTKWTKSAWGKKLLRYSITID